MPVKTVVCLGDSLTCGLISANFVEMLALQFGNAHCDFRFVNSGVNGDLAYNVLERLDEVVALDPDCVLLMIGTNDIIATLRRSNLWISRISKLLPCNPDFKWFRKNVETIVRRLKSETHAHIGLASPPILGECLDSTSNKRLRVYNTALQEIAACEGLTYLPVYEHIAGYLESNCQHAGKAHQSRLFMTAELTVRHIFLKESFISISQRKGFTIMTDGVHLNEKGAGLVAEVYASFLTNWLKEINSSDFYPTSVEKM
jgi:acyl-CoA thioesterase I